MRIPFFGGTVFRNNVIITHELTHGLTNRLTGGGTGLYVLFPPLSDQRGILLMFLGPLALLSFFIRSSRSLGNRRCLSTTEAGGMSEGWSDAVAFWSEQNSTTPIDFVMGAWATDDGSGIRRSRPYSTNMQTNPYTYATVGIQNEGGFLDSSQVFISSPFLRFGWTPPIRFFCSSVFSAWIGASFIDTSPFHLPSFSSNDFTTQFTPLEKSGQQC